MIIDRQVRKEKRLIKRLFVRMVIDFKIDRTIPLKLRFRSKGLHSSCYSWSDIYSGIIKRQSIVFNLNGNKIMAKVGYSNSYYNGRGNAVNPCILHNRHNIIRFILLHELGHAINSRKHIDYDDWSECKKELASDNFAIEHIKKY